MLIKDIFRVIDTSQCTRICITPVSRPVLGQMPSAGRFVCIGLTDREKMAQVEDLEVEKLSIMNDMICVNV